MKRALAWAVIAMWFVGGVALLWWVGTWKVVAAVAGAIALAAATLWAIDTTEGW